VAGYTKLVYPETVTHPSINRARRRVTTLTETNALPLSHATINIAIPSEPAIHFFQFTQLTLK